MSKTFRMKDGDLYFSVATGKGELLEGPNKASQDIAEVLMTPLDKKRGYGSELDSLEVPTFLTPLVGQGLVSIKVTEAIQRLQAFQQKDPEATADERIASIAKLNVRQLNSTDFAFFLLAELESGAVSPERILTVSLRHKQSSQVIKALNDIARVFVPGSEVGNG